MVCQSLEVKEDRREGQSVESFENPVKIAVGQYYARLVHRVQIQISADHGLGLSHSWRQEESLVGGWRETVWRSPQHP